VGSGEEEDELRHSSEGMKSTAEVLEDAEVRR
jgi:hypothetical protein